ncbi:MAG: M81 family metallopeptidase [Rhodospirillaceae bacterium]|nr:M81 family metallopeptidase [Rhodospirillaceae bacterium]
MIRIATAGFLHESNTFSTVPASLEKFRRAGTRPSRHAPTCATYGRPCVPRVR